MKNIKVVIAMAVIFSMITKISNAQNAVSDPADKKVVLVTIDDIAKLKAAVEADPEDIKAHQEYIKAVGFEDPDRLIRQYDVWMKQFPKSVTVPFAIGQGFYKKERAEASPYLLKVVAMDPKRGDVFEMLAIDACRWGDYPANARYEKLAMEADPTNYMFARHYALALKGRDNGEWKLLCREVEKRFAGTDYATQALGMIGTFSHDPKEKEAIYLEQIKKYPADKFPSTKSAIASLAALYVVTAPDKSIALYKEVMAMDTSRRNKDGYQKNINYAVAIMTGRDLINEKKYKEALELLSGIKVARFDLAAATSKLAMMKAEALHHTGNTLAAYDSLLTRVISKPSDAEFEAIRFYGRKLGKDAKQIDADQWKLINEKAKEAADFNLYAYLEKKNISLKDLRGKTVFLSFWFPGCGPCRAEMVHLEPVVRKFKNKDFAYIGVNGVTEQDPYVESFMRKTGFSFTPLQDKEAKIAKAYGVRGYPTNFIIDPNGKIIYTGFMISNPEGQRMLELMIQSVIDHKKS